MKHTSCAAPSPASPPAPPAALKQPRSPRGGPRTEAGKARSRQNALTHGLTAEALVPQVFGEELLAGHCRRFRAEWQPVGPTEEALVEELARHAAAMERAAAAETPVCRSGARAVGHLYLSRSRDRVSEGAAVDAVFAAGITTDSIERLTRYRRAHEKAFHRALAQLEERQDARRRHRVHNPTAALSSLPAPRFDSEAACAAHLRRRFEEGLRPCPDCRAREGRWLESRQRWRCTGCGRQLTVRTGTVMAGSKVPLAAWFAAVRAIVENPAATTTELAAATGIHREATVRAVATKIRAALDSLRVGELLAGLDEVFGPSGGRAPGGARSPFLRNELPGERPNATLQIASQG